MDSEPFLSRVIIRNYKSIPACDVRLGRLTFLVGPNGAGKSNFLDALKFIADALGTSLEHAIRERGGLDEVRRRSHGHPHHFGMRLDARLPGGVGASYSFRIGAKGRGGYEVQEEQCVVRGVGAQAWFHVRAGQVVDSSVRTMPAAAADRLYLVNASGVEPFRALYDALAQMGFYNPSPDVMRQLQRPGQPALLARDGGNITSVVERLLKEREQTVALIEELLSRIVPGVTGVGVKTLGPMETLEFRQRVVGAEHPWRFLAHSMSDGTLRAFGILVALFQGDDGSRVPLVGIEEPEVALHPAAAGLLNGALRRASRTTQVLVTSHSPDLLDDLAIGPDELLGVAADGNASRIGPLDQAARDALARHLYTAGELLRLDQLAPAGELCERLDPPLDLFGGAAP